MGHLKGKRVMITGAGRAGLSGGRSCGSIGYGMATAFAKEELERLCSVQMLTVQADVSAGADNKKEGIRGLSRAAATERGPDGINVNVICPIAWTAKPESFRNACPDTLEANVKMPPMGRYGETLTLEGGHGAASLSSEQTLECR